MKISDYGWIGIGVFIVCMILVGLIYIMPDPNNYTHPANVTIREKYAQYEYKTWCGKSYCYNTEQAKIVGIDGTLYPIQDEALWAKLEINKSYVLIIGDLPTTRGQVLSVEGV